MRFAVTHTTRYRYSRAVLLGPHLLRLRPRCDGSQQLTEFRMRVQPRPIGWSECLDLEGNSVAQVWFDGRAESLTVSSSFRIETLRTNPFDYILAPAASCLPPPADPPREAMLAAYRRRSETDDCVARFAEDVRGDTGGETVAFLGALSRRIAERCSARIRLEGDPQPPSFTLREGTGACRDVAVLFIDCCRVVGLAARFVSGYYGGQSAEERRYLHAWAEVYLPGVGWRGFDPQQGLAVADQHVAVAAGAHPCDAAPITGSLHGGDATTSLDVEVRIESVGT